MSMMKVCTILLLFSSAFYISSSYNLIEKNNVSNILDTNITCSDCLRIVKEMEDAFNDRFYPEAQNIIKLCESYNLSACVIATQNIINGVKRFEKNVTPNNLCKGIGLCPNSSFVH